MKKAIYTYLGEKQKQQFSLKRKELGWPSDASYLRKLINEGMKKKYIYDNI